MLRQRVHRVPADLGVDENESPDSGENIRHAGVQLHAAQGVHAQVEEVQVRDAGDDGADLQKNKRKVFTFNGSERKVSQKPKKL